MDVPVLINTAPENAAPITYDIQSTRYNRVFSDRFYMSVSPYPVCKGAKLAVFENRYQLIFEQLIRLIHPTELKTVVRYSTVRSERRVAGHSNAPAIKTKKQPVSQEEKSKIYTTLNNEKKRSALLRRLFDSFRTEFSENPRDAVLRWYRTVCALVENAGYVPFSFQVFDRIATRKEYVKILDNVTEYTEIVNFEMFVDLLSRHAVFFKKEAG